MMKKLLYIGVGVSGVGKSTWIKNRIAQNGGAYISRDEIRYSMLQPGDNYFDNEKEVVNTFCAIAQDNIDNGVEKEIYLDATHLSPKSRRKVLSRLNLQNVEKVILLYFNIPTEIAIQRNAQRTGMACVPEGVIIGMAKSLFIDFENKEDNVDEIWEINEKGEVVNVKDFSNIWPTFGA